MGLGEGEDQWDLEKMEGGIGVEEDLDLVLVREWEPECLMESGEEEKLFPKVLRLVEGVDMVVAEEGLEGDEVADGENEM